VAVIRGEQSIDDIQRTAHRILVENGLDAVSMRRVADAVGVWPTALYHHIGDKEGLPQLALDAVLAEVDVPDGGVHGRAGCRGLRVVRRSSRS
jgi:AcrR family transcriptional regulator